MTLTNTQWTPSQLLKATGGIWRIITYRDGNRRHRGPIVFVRANCILKAEEIGRRRSKCPVVHAFPWDPRKEVCFGRLIQFNTVVDGGHQ